MICIKREQIRLMKHLDGYIKESTESEIKYVKIAGKKVNYIEK